MLFSYVACIGTYTAGIYKTNQLWKAKFGKSAYYLEAIKETFNIKNYSLDITIGKRVYKEKDVILALVLNTKSVAGFKYFNHKENRKDVCGWLMFIDKFIKR